MPRSSLILAIVTILLYCSLYHCDTSANSDDIIPVLHYTLHHRLDTESSYQPRGKAEVNFALKNNIVKFNTQQFSTAQWQALRKLNDEQLQRTLYSLQFQSTNTYNDPLSQPALIVSIPIIQVLCAHGRESFLFLYDAAGTLQHINYQTVRPDCSVSEARSFLHTSDAIEFTSKAKISFGRPAERPKAVQRNIDVNAAAQASAPGADPVATPPPSSSDTNDPSAPGNDGKKEVPQTFWQKYWIYIVPIGIFMLLQSFVAPPQQGGQGGARGS